MRKNNNTNTNATANTNANFNINNIDEFHKKLGELISQFFINSLPEGMSKFSFIIDPALVNPEKPTEPAPEKKPSKVDVIKQYGKEGLGVTFGKSYKFVSEETWVFIKRIIDKHSELKIKTKVGGGSRGYINCVPAIEAFIKRIDGGDKLIEEAIDILVATGHQNTGHGITWDKVELVTRILALHQKRGRSKAKEALIDILNEHTINSLTVLAKDTKKYVQRTNADMRVLFVESEIAKRDGVRNQLEK